MPTTVLRCTAALAVVLAGFVALLATAPSVYADGSGGETINVSIPSATSSAPGPTTDDGSGGSDGSGDSDAGSAGPGSLAWTGINVLAPVGGALVLVAAGVALTVAGRRRRHG